MVTFNAMRALWIGGHPFPLADSRQGIKWQGNAAKSAKILLPSKKIVVNAVTKFTIPVFTSFAKSALMRALTLPRLVCILVDPSLYLSTI
jgi:hypothetical protein